MPHNQHKQSDQPTAGPVVGVMGLDEYLPPLAAFVLDF